MGLLYGNYGGRGDGFQPGGNKGRLGFGPPHCSQQLHVVRSQDIRRDNSSLGHQSGISMRHHVGMRGI